MIPLTLGEVATITGGLLADADAGTPVTAPVSFDSRHVPAGGLFLALPGENADGHDYAAAAVAGGAVAALVTRDLPGVPRIRVADGLTALADLAREVLRRCPDVTVIGVTGSSGKTSTKDLLAQLLNRLGPTIAPPGSFNNELGHPFTVLQVDASTRYLVLEKSARGPGHIRFLTEIAPPRIGVVLNVGSAHLGEFGSREAIARAKGELVEALPPDGVAVLNADDPAVAAMASRTNARVVLTGESPRADVRAQDVTIGRLGQPSFTLVTPRGEARVELGLSGEHQVANALAAAAVAVELGMPLGEVAEALGAARPVSRWRMEVTERSDGVVIVNDAYNANPESMRAGLTTLARMARDSHGRSWAVLGEMAELGETSGAEHDALGRLAVRLDVGRLVAVGDGARRIAGGAALEGSWDGEAAWVPDAEAALQRVRAGVRPGDVVLVKASHSVGLERMAEVLAADSSAADSSEEGGPRT